jgi:hypothetical protein
MDYRVGYWCVRFDGQQFVADTFLFLTMEGTPEGDQLWRKLRMRRADRERTDLDKLPTFVASDIREDTELVDILTDCGCGDLFKLADALQTESHIAGSAAYFRSYVGSNRVQQALARIRDQSSQRPDDANAEVADERLRRGGHASTSQDTG